MIRQGVRTVSKAVYQISVVTFVASVVWISLGVYEAFTTPPEINVPEEVLRPINPVIDMELLMSLETREQLGESVDELLLQAEASGTLPTNTEVGSGVDGSVSEVENTPVENEEIVEEVEEEEASATPSGELEGSQ